MAWMFAGTEHDMTVGMHLHYHFLPPLMPPTPFYPHPAIGMIKDKLAKNTKADNRKCAITGSKTKILLPPHLPLLGPLCTGMPKENTGIQQVWMGAGIGAHPLGGIGFVVIEGKPAAGMLSNCMGCWSVAPGLDMMLPFIGLDFIMVPTRGVSVMYGPAPLALDLFVLLLTMLRNLFDFILNKIPDGPWKDVLEIAMDSVMEGAEVFCDALEHGASFSEALGKAGDATVHAFVDKAVEKIIDKTVGKVFDKVGFKGDGWKQTAGNFLLDKGKDAAKDWLKDKTMDGLKDLTGGDKGILGRGEAASKEKKDRTSKADSSTSPFGGAEDVIEFGAGVANKSQANRYKDFKKSEEKAAKNKQAAADAKKEMNDAKDKGDEKAFNDAKVKFNEAKNEQNKAEKNKWAAANGENNNKYVKDVVVDKAMDKGFDAFTDLFKDDEGKKKAEDKRAEDELKDAKDLQKDMKDDRKERRDAAGAGDLQANNDDKNEGFWGGLIG